MLIVCLDRGHFHEGELLGLGYCKQLHEEMEFCGEFSNVPEEVTWGHIEYSNGLMYDGETRDFHRHGMVIPSVLLTRLIYWSLVSIGSAVLLADSADVLGRTRGILSFRSRWSEFPGRSFGLYPILWISIPWQLRRWHSSRRRNSLAARWSAIRRAIRSRDRDPMRPKADWCLKAKRWLTPIYNEDAMDFSDIAWPPSPCALLGEWAGRSGSCWRHPSCSRATDQPEPLRSPARFYCQQRLVRAE